MPTREKHRVHVVAHGARGIDCASHPGVARARRGRRRHGDPAGFQFVLDADHRGPVAGVDLQIPSRTWHHLAGGRCVLAVDHRHRRQVGVDLAQSPVARRLGSPDNEFDTGRVELVRVTRQNCLDDGWCREVGDVQDRAGAVNGVHRFAQHVVGQTRHHADSRAIFSCQQGDFKVYRVVGPGADDGACAMHPGAEEIGGSG